MKRRTDSYLILKVESILTFAGFFKDLPRLKTKYEVFFHSVQQLTNLNHLMRDLSEVAALLENQEFFK